MNKIIKENITKNIILIIILILFYPLINTYLTNNNLVNDVSASGNILIATSIIAVIACFGNFAFTYEKINVKKTFDRYLAHLTTGLLMLIIGISLIFTNILIAIIMGNFILVNITLFLLYIACVGYDLLDVLRIR
ncbi:MAG: hypothetical protein U9O94_04265 [Nanoarchaeota archaeon]|nr:hypothetical protein [Nanoarchaeota archaeon]